MVNYVFHLIIGTLVFVVWNLVLLPFAYLKTLGSKIGLVSKGAIGFCDGLSYLVFGIPLLLALQVMDAANFISWSSRTDDFSKPKKAYLTREQFESFYQIL